MWVEPRVVAGHVKRYVAPVLEPLGFERKGKLRFRCISDNLLQSVTLERKFGGIDVEVSIQPLFVPESAFVYAFGSRLGYLSVGSDYSIQLEDEQSLVTGLERAAFDLRNFAVPWFERLRTVRALVDWYADSSPATWNGPKGTGLSQQFYIWMGFCHAYLGEYQAALFLIENYLDRAIRKEWPAYQTTAQLLQILKENTSAVPLQLQTWAEETKANLKLTS